MEILAKLVYHRCSASVGRVYVIKNGEERRAAPHNAPVDRNFTRAKFHQTLNENPDLMQNHTTLFPTRSSAL